MHEIVTLQFGQQSNYLGTHFWNTQESYFTYPPEQDSPVNHDIHFRAGTAPDGSDTFTPRALLYDLKGAFGSMKKVNALYEAEEDANVDGSVVWPSKPIVHRSAPIPQSAYQTHLDAGLDPPPLTTSTVRYWSDFSRVYYHPRSLVPLSEFDVNDSLMPFEKWQVGMELFEKLEREDDLVDRDLRRFVEECDGLQGLQIITGIDDAWGGWASGWLERLRDEYGKLSIWTWGVGDQGGNMSTPREKRLQQIENSSRSLQVLGEQSSVYIPISNTPIKTPSYVTLDSTSAWQVSALQAMAVESMTLSSRLRSGIGGRGSLQDLEETFNSTGKRRIAKLEMTVADASALSEKARAEGEQGEKLKTKRQASEAHDGVTQFDIDAFTKDYRVGRRRAMKREHVFGRAEAVRGDWNVNRAAEGGDTGRLGDEPVVQRFAAPVLFPILDSFPGTVLSVLGSTSHGKVAVHSGLTTSTEVGEQVRAVEAIVRRMHMVGIDEREGLCDGLQTMAEEYEHGWDSGSDSDADE